MNLLATAEFFVRLRCARQTRKFQTHDQGAHVMQNFLVRTTSGGKKAPVLTLTARVKAADKAKAIALAIESHRTQVPANRQVTLVGVHQEVAPRPNVGESLADFRARTGAFA